MDQGSEPTLKWIFGQGFPKLHPFGLSPLINDQCYTSTVTVSNTDLGPVLLGAPAKDYSIPISVAICFPSEYHQGGTAPRSGSGCRVGTSSAVLPGTLIPGPSEATTIRLLHSYQPARIDQGSVLAVERGLYQITIQPEVVPRQLLLCLLSQEAYPIYYLTRDLSSGIYN